MPWKFFDSTGAEKQISVPRASLVTALPSNPSDGDEIIFTDSLTAPTYQWHFRYVSAKSSNKWVFVGGPSLIGEDADAGTRTNTAYGDLSDTADSPQITIPLAGDYIIDHGAYIAISTAAQAFMSYDIGGTGAVDADGIAITGNSPNEEGSLSRSKKKSLTAVALKAKYKTSAGTVTCYNRYIAATPIAVGG